MRVEVEVELDHFEDDEILRAARFILERRIKKPGPWGDRHVEAIAERRARLHAELGR